MSPYAGSCQPRRIGVVVCDNVEKWGGTTGLGQKYIDAFTGGECSKNSSTSEEWHIFGAVEGEVPSEKDLDNFDGFILTGSAKSANDDIKWIYDLKKFISSAAAKPSNARIVGICFGHQLIGAALGGEVTANPSKKFVLQSEQITVDENFKGNEVLRNVAADNSGSLRLLQCHGDCVSTLPPGAQSLAKSASCEHEMVQFTENIFGLQAHPEFTVQDYKEHLLPELLASGQIDENGKKLCEETIALPLDSVKMMANLKKFVSKDDN